MTLGGKRRRRIRAKTSLLKHPRLDGVLNYSTRYTNIYYDGKLERFVFIKGGIVAESHENLKALV